MHYMIGGIMRSVLRRGFMRPGGLEGGGRGGTAVGPLMHPHVLEGGPEDRGGALTVRGGARALHVWGHHALRAPTTIHASGGVRGGRGRGGGFLLAYGILHT